MYTVLFIGGFFAKSTVLSAKFTAVQVLQPEGRRGSFQSPKIMTQVEKKSNILGKERPSLWEPSLQIREDADTTGRVSSWLVLQGREPSSLFWRFGLSFVCFTNEKGWHRKCNWLTQSHTASQWQSWGKNPLLLSWSSNASIRSIPLAHTLFTFFSPPPNQFPRYRPDYRLNASHSPVS